MGGKSRIGALNEVGKQLTEFHEVNKLFIMNMLQTAKQKTIYMDITRWQYRNKIDYIIRKRKNFFLSVKTRPEVDCGIDDECLILTIRMKPKYNTKILIVSKYNLNDIPQELKEFRMLRDSTKQNCITRSKCAWTGRIETWDIIKEESIKTIPVAIKNENSC